MNDEKYYIETADGEHNLQSDEGDSLIRFPNDKRELRADRPRTFWHGDHNMGIHMVLKRMAYVLR